MKTLKSHTIYYDGVCPMCKLYTRAFVRTGMLDPNGRAPYQLMTKKEAEVIDCRRAVNEIALLDRDTGKVYYGVESLMRVIGHSFPLFKPLFRFRPFFWLADKAYRFVSYNRRVIMPAGRVQQSMHQPAFHKGYRVAFIVLAWLVTALILYRFSLRLVPLLAPGTFAREFAICGGQLLWQGALLIFIQRNRILHYLGHLMTISLAGALMLGLFLFIGNLTGLSHPLAYLGFFGLTVAGMLLEHLRRCRLLQLSLLVTASWVLYRVLTLLFLVWKP